MGVHWTRASATEIKTVPEAAKQPPVGRQSDNRERSRKTNMEFILAACLSPALFLFSLIPITRSTETRVLISLALQLGGALILLSVTWQFLHGKQAAQRLRSQITGQPDNTSWSKNQFGRYSSPASSGWTCLTNDSDESMESALQTSAVPSKRAGESDSRGCNWARVMREPQIHGRVRTCPVAYLGHTCGAGSIVWRGL